MIIKAVRKKLDRRSIGRLISLLKEKMKDEGIPFVKMFLFGSYINGTAHKDSDVDVAIIVSSNISQSSRKKLHMIHWLAKQVNVKLEAHIISDGDLKNPYLTLPAEILKYGVAI